MGKISRLSPHIINLIAAGEVVERPASVVKELIENSIDANATHIKLFIEDFGTKLIEIHDDGDGIDEEDISLMFEQHATSKISKSADLKAISSFGFRGEALASIRSVASKIEVRTQPAQGSASNYVVTPTTINKTEGKTPTRGTIIAIHELFSTVPARKKFLKSENTENMQVKDTVMTFAISNPKIHFELSIDNKRIFNFPSSNSYYERINQILSASFTNDAFETNVDNTNPTNVYALWGNTSLAKSRSPKQYLFVNGRPVQNKTVQSAAHQAYQGFIHKSLKPAYIIFLQISPEEVDVNVHPRKLEVKFTNPKEIFSLVYNSAKHTLEKQSRASLRENISPQINKNIQSTARRQHTTVSQFSRTNIKQNAKPIQQAMKFTESLLEMNEETAKNVNYTDENISTIGSVMQLFNTYILFERNDKLIIIDQHAAAEKIAFERILKDYGENKTKPLLVPISVSVSSEDQDQLIRNKKDFDEIGITLEAMGNTTVNITEIPEIVTKLDAETLIEKYLHATNEYEGSYKEYASQTPQPLSEEAYYLIATTACHGSIRAGQSLTEIEMKRIIEDLYQLDHPNNCPHGRPTHYILEKYEIEKFFKRVL